MARRINRIVPLTSLYVIVLVGLGFVFFAAAKNAPFVWQVETEIGHPLSCNEAYNRREIDAYFYPERSSEGNALYLFSLCSPIILLSFLLLTVGVGMAVRRSEIAATSRWVIYGLAGVGLVELIALLAYSPTIYLIGCATE